MITSKFQEIFNTFIRELKRMISRPIYVIGTILVMVFCFVFFLTIFKEGLPNKMPVAIVDKDNSALSRQFTRNLNSTQYANIIMKTADHSEAREEMQKGKIYAFVEIEKGFARNILSNRRPIMKFYVNNSYLIAGSLLFKDISYMSALTSAAVQRQILRAKGVEEYRMLDILQPIVINTHQIGNPWANYGVYLLNVLLPGVLQLMILLMTVYSIGIELKEKTTQNWIKNSNNSFFSAIVGKLIPYTIIFSVMGIISNVLLYKLMHYPMNSSIGWMFFCTILYVLAYQALGILFIGITPLLRDAVTLSAFYGLLGFTFAGFTFPIEQLPYMSRIFSYFFPIRHYFNFYVDHALHGLAIQNSFFTLIIMLGFNLIPLIVIKRLKNAVLLHNYPTV